MTRCPVCSSLLYRRVVAGVTLDGCPSCGGAWMDKGELQTLARDPVGLKMVDQAFPPGVEPPAGARTGACPRCGEALVEFEYATFRGVRLDRCKACEGVWLDHGEAGQVAERVISAKPAAPAQNNDFVAPSENPSASVAARFGAPKPATAPLAAAAMASARSAPAVVTVADPTSTSQLPLVRGVAVGSYDRSSGFFTSIERGMRFIKGAYGLALECPRLLIPLTVGALVQLLIGGAVIAVGMAMPHGAGAGAGASHGDQLFAQGGLVMMIGGVLFGFLASFFNMAILGMTVSMVDAYLKGLEPNWRVAARDVMKNAGGVVAMAVVSMIVSMLTSRDQHGHRGILASMIDTAWTVLSYLMMPIIMIEDVGMGTAFRRAKEIHSRGLLQLAVGEVGLRAIAGISAFLVIGVFGLLGFLIMPQRLAGIVALVAVAVVCLVAIGVLNAFARGAYYTCLYLWAVEVERAGDPARAMVPAPLATALAP